MGCGRSQRCENGNQALEYINKKQKLSVVILDLTLPGVTGKELLDIFQLEYPQVPVLIITASVHITDAVECIKKGASDYVIKPVDNARFITCIRLALKINNLTKEISSLRDSVLENELKEPDIFASIITRNEKILQIFHYIEAIAGSDEPVLITGESGTGKELIARSIHSASKRTGEFISCFALYICSLINPAIQDACHLYR